MFSDEFYIILDILIPLYIAYTGYKYWKRTPEMGATGGFRSKRSMKSKEAWGRAHQLSGQLFLYGGIVLLLITGASYLFVDIGNLMLQSFIHTGIDLVYSIAVFPITNLTLKKEFGD